jgi:hypothetical protein
MPDDGKVADVRGTMVRHSSDDERELAWVQALGDKIGELMSAS